MSNPLAGQKSGPYEGSAISGCRDRGDTERNEDHEYRNAVCGVATAARNEETERMMIKQLMQRAVAVLAVTTALATGAVSAQAADAAVFGDNAGTVSTGVHLSPGQFQALQAAAAHNPALTGAQARQILANSAAGAGASGIHPNGWGSGSSKGPCGTAVLQGDTYGRWNFSLSFNVSQVGTASVGGVSVSTNAAYGAGSKGFGVSGGYVYHDSLRDGVLGSIGWGATGDTLSGWALTNGAWFCEIDVTAIWH